MFTHALEYGDDKNWNAVTEGGGYGLFLLIFLSILYLLLPLSALGSVVHYGACGNATSEMFVIDGSEAQLQGLSRCLSASALLSPGIPFNLQHPAAGCKLVCFLLALSLMQILEQQPISSMHKEDVLGDWKSATKSYGAGTSGSNFSMSAWITSGTEMAAKHERALGRGERLFHCVPLGFHSRRKG